MAKGKFNTLGEIVRACESSAIGGLVDKFAEDHEVRISVAVDVTGMYIMTSYYWMGELMTGDIRLEGKRSIAYVTGEGWYVRNADRCYEPLSPSAVSW